MYFLEKWTPELTSNPESLGYKAHVSFRYNKITLQKKIASSAYSGYFKDQTFNLHDL